MRLKLIANPASGGDARSEIEQAVSFLTHAGASVDLFLTGTRGDARSAAADAGGDYDRLVVLGGDGTLNEVLNGCKQATLPIAFLPLGTVNVFALEAGIPFDLEAACRLAVSGTPVPISLGRIEAERFVLMASAGWDAEAVAGLRTGLKRWIGRIAYLVSAVEALLRQPPRPIELILSDGRTETGYGTVVSNCRCYGGKYVVTPEASMFSDTLEVCLLHRPGRLAQLGFALRLALGRPLPPSTASFFSVSECSLSGEGVAVQVDGDSWGKLPVRLAIEPEAVTMILPDSPGG